MLKKSPLIHFYTHTILISLVFFSLFRLVYWGVFNDTNNPVPFKELLTAFYLGIKFDLRLILIIILPLFLTAWIKPFNPVLTKHAKTFWLGYLTLAFGITVFYYIADFIHYSYLHKPLDASVLRFAEDFSISLNMMWQSYPIVWLFIGLFITIFIYNNLLRRFTRPIIKQATSSYRFNKYFYKRRWWQQSLLVSLCIFIFIFGLFGKFSYYPLRWSDAFASTHPFAPAVTVNPVVHFFDTLKNKRINFDMAKARASYHEIAGYLGIATPKMADDPGKALNFKRQVSQAGALAATSPNIVMVFLESFASYKTGIFGNKLNPTPHFDKIANNAILFKRYYAPHVGTARSVFTGITGIPDIEVHKTSSRNPLIVDQHTLVNAFTGYNKHYFLGGSANWGNIRGVLSHNIKNLQIHEEGDYSARRVDVWGISDLDLFIEANQILKKQTQPFFAIIQTSGNHRPYTIPENNQGFKTIKQSKATLQKNGFISEKEYNSFRFMDHSIGHFIKLAKNEKYFANTVFVFFGDHGISGYGGEHTPRFESDFDLTGLHVPFVIYAPGLLKAKVYNKVASEVDILPTLAALISKGYTNTTLGRDLLNPRFDKQRYAFTITHENNPKLGLISANHYLKVLADGSNAQLFATDATQFPSEKSQTTPHPDDISLQQPQLAEKYKRLALGIYETSRYMLYHNKPLTPLSNKSDPGTN
ncbi:LTA synthase family protein [Beggiatoa alba]|nr:LTA synthase family protein [Beggiatoa alba]